MSWSVCYLKGRSLRCSPGRGNAGGCAVTLYMGEGPRGSNGSRSTLHRSQSLPLLPTIKLGPSGAGSRVGGFVHTLGPPWFSPTTSPVRLGVSPTAAPTPTGIFNQRFEALFPRAGALGCVVCFAPRCSSGLSVRECGATGSASGQTACPFRPTLHQSRSCHGHVSLLCPGARIHPSYRSGCMFLFYLLGVGLPCRSIFCQFWLCEEAQCVYLCHHVGSP